EQRHRVADPDVRARAGHDRVADGEALGSQDVALLAVRVVQQRDARRTVRIVLDAGDLGRNPVLLAPKFDAAILPLVAPALPAVGDVALVVASARAPQRLEQRLFGLRLRDVGEVGDRAEPRGRRDRLELTDAHISQRTPGYSHPL